MREKKQLLEFAKNHQGQEFILATLTQTEGSTYRKAGAQKLITTQGNSLGLISGGCLEAEIVDKALSMTSNKESHQFDTTAETDRLFGYNLGCAGQLTIEFEKIDYENLVTEKYIGLSQKDTLDVHVIGAGADTDPLYELMQWLGWNQNYYSMRSDIVKQRQEQGWPIKTLDFSNFVSHLKNLERSAILLMSHNYPTDLEALSKIISLPVAYIGVLGPEKRKQQLLEDLNKIHDIDVTPLNTEHIQGPMGIMGKGRGETAVALSIVSELQSRFFSKEPK
ncbi:MAG: XdhC family protein [Bdellovibrionales bacterium]|nr:XdhC family protein [Bdellovibrionales bacterium]